MLSKALRALKRSHSYEDEAGSGKARTGSSAMRSEFPKGAFDIFSSSSNAAMTSLDESPEDPLMLDSETIVLPPPPVMGLEMVSYTARHYSAC